MQGHALFGCWGGDYVDIVLDGQSLRSRGYASSSDLYSNTTTAFQGNIVSVCGTEKKLIKPNGVTYTFGRNYNYSLNGKNITISNVKSIKDRFGNEIKYFYNNVSVDVIDKNGDQVELMVPVINKILTPEGLSVQFILDESTPNLITRIEYGGRTLSYSVDQNNYLTTFTDMQGRPTQYEYEDVQSGVRSINLLSKVKIPFGAEIEYTYGDMSNNGAKNCSIYKTCPQVCYVAFAAGFDFSDCYKTSVSKRTVSGPDIETQETNYLRNWSSSNQTTVNVIQKNYAGSSDRNIKHEFHRVEKDQSNSFSGKTALNGLRKHISISLDNIKISEMDLIWNYAKAGTIGCSRPRTGSNSYLQCGWAKLSVASTKLFREGGEDTFVQRYLSYDKYGNWTKKYSDGSLANKSGGALFESQSWTNDMRYWLIGLPVTLKISTDNTSWSEASKYTYHASTGPYKRKLKHEYKNGLYYRHHSEYYPTGDLKKTTYSGSYYYELYQNYKNGKAQTYKVPNRYSTSGVETRFATFNDFAELTSSIDFNGNLTSYLRPTGLVQKIYFPSPRIEKNTIYNLGNNYKLEYSGYYSKYTHWDALGRVKKIAISDSSNPDSTLYQTFSYNAYGKKIYQSYPSSDANPNLGVHYSYDGLGEKISEYHDAEGKNVTWNFINGNRIRYTDSYGNVTTTRYRAIGRPSYEKPLEVIFPENTADTINISYNIFGNITQIVQGEVSELRSYDQFQRLCKVSRPDTGITSFGYNPQSQISWKANGTTGDETGCEGDSLTDVITYVYDNQLDFKKSTLSFDNSVIQDIVRDPNGNIVSLSSQNATWSYQYNSLDKVDQEALSVNGSTYVIEWGYDNLGNISSLTYPNGELVSFQPDALGRPTKSGAYATNVEYHPSGVIKSFDYGNNLSRSVDVSASGRIIKIRDFYNIGYSKPSRFNYTYTYDKEGNLGAVYNHVESAYSLSSFLYDGINQLNSVSGKWGIMTLEYDNLFNLRKKTTTNPSSSIFYNYGSNNRLSSISGAQARSFQYDQRGNVISNGLRVFSYDPLSRMITSGNSLYYYDGNDKIVSTVDSSGETISIYSKNGNLISQFFPDGSETNYIRLNNLLIAKNTIGNGSANAPIALDDEWTIERCEDFTFNPTINDSDVDGDEISIVSVDNPDITIINDTTLYYGGNCSRIDVHFNYTISDEAGNTATAHVFIDIDD